MMEDDSAEKGEMQESNTSDDIVMQMTNDNSSSITQVDSSFKVNKLIQDPYLLYSCKNDKTQNNVFFFTLLQKRSTTTATRETQLPWMTRASTK